jgi:hypothetical protein
VDFIERLFGFSPDGGNGTFELSLLVVPLLIAVLIWAKWRRSHRIG